MEDGSKAFNEFVSSSASVNPDVNKLKQNKRLKKVVYHIPRYDEYKQNPEDTTETKKSVTRNPLITLEIMVEELIDNRDEWTVTIVGKDDMLEEDESERDITIDELVDGVDIEYDVEELPPISKSQYGLVVRFSHTAP